MVQPYLPMELHNTIRAFAAASLRSFILLRTFLPSSPSIKSFTTLAISSLSTIPLSLAFGLNATLTSSVIITAFILCSAYSGQATNGTPFTTLSRIEFHPQCVKNPPVDGWLRTWACGAHDSTRSPRPLVLSTKPFGRKLPSASSFICAVERAPPLPNDTNNTLPRGSVWRGGASICRLRFSCLEPGRVGLFRGPECNRGSSAVHGVRCTRIEPLGRCRRRRCRRGQRRGREGRWEGGEGAEGVAERGEGMEDGEGDEGFNLGVVREERAGNGWEEGVGDGGRKGAEEGGLALEGGALVGMMRTRERWWWRDESFGEFNHRDEVAHAWGRHDGHQRCLWSWRLGSVPWKLRLSRKESNGRELAN
ncbi:hypothetical protein G2W53_017324 [Senna tora]|uniref:Uncharacterized protein n=1 Tax=Senna tora TaxID=362788 RepID=A0A834WK29_9FABA|nr:hypothetical protein G2W53_017324 [Senna tora]